LFAPQNYLAGKAIKNWKTQLQIRGLRLSVE